MSVDIIAPNGIMRHAHALCDAHGIMSIDIIAPNGIRKIFTGTELFTNGKKDRF